MNQKRFLILMAMYKTYVKYVNDPISLQIGLKAAALWGAGIINTIWDYIFHLKRQNLLWQINSLDLNPPKEEVDYLAGIPMHQIEADMDQIDKEGFC